MLSWNVYDRGQEYAGTLTFAEGPLMEEVYAALQDHNLLNPDVDLRDIFIDVNGHRKMWILHFGEVVYTLTPNNHHLDLRVRLHYEVDEAKWTPELRERLRYDVERLMDKLHEDYCFSGAEGVSLEGWDVLIDEGT